MIELEELVEPCPGPPALSTTVTCQPSRDNSNATAEPITPAPMTIALLESTKLELTEFELTKLHNLSTLRVDE